jgi:hypothetical protein
MKTDYMARYLDSLKNMDIDEKLMSIDEEVGELRAVLDSHAQHRIKKVVAAFGSIVRELCERVETIEEGGARSH